MITEQQIDDAYILFVSGAAEFKKDGRSKMEICMEDDDGKYTVEFVDNGRNRVIERWYDYSGGVSGEISYVDNHPFRERWYNSSCHYTVWDIDASPKYREFKGWFVPCEPFDSLFEEIKQ